MQTSLYFAAAEASHAGLMRPQERAMIRMKRDSAAIGDEAVDNDHTSFDAIYSDYHARIVRYLARLVGVDEAEDLGQEVFLKISRSLDGFRGESAVLTWVYRIATNTAIESDHPHTKRKPALLVWTNPPTSAAKASRRKIDPLHRSTKPYAIR